MVLLGLLLSLSPPPNSAIFDRIVAHAKAGRWRQKRIGERTILVAREFLGIPYVGHTLDADPSSEKCVIRLDGLDCVTFYETSFAFARILGSAKSPSFNDLINSVTNLRYRGGKLADYTSRLYYTTDWMLDNTRRGNVEVVSSEIGVFEESTRPINFMTTHAKLYPALVGNPSFVPVLARLETQLTSQVRLFVPKAKVKAFQTQLKSGDIVGICTDVPGLDCSHTGLIVVEKGEPRFFHASSDGKKVLIGPVISEYLDKHAKATGLMVVRPEN
ncbi:MAG: DUF1460 domain-containing protein [Armatimonadetes bacterium]|nr:DUF1460 domain-containing protein [Armatimonadota bacterium]